LLRLSLSNEKPAIAYIPDYITRPGEKQGTLSHIVGGVGGEQYDGYYAIVTSEWQERDEKILDIYRGLWQIEHTDEVTQAIHEIIGIDLGRRYMTLGEIRQLIGDTKK
jgi:hypothetical protein